LVLELLSSLIVRVRELRLSPQHGCSPDVCSMHLAWLTPETYDASMVPEVNQE
jgi:hypothetical protein